jgi:indolepyruvate ferredoxin oxidoreductase
MGGEGANWIGEAPFSKRGHVFQNIGDGTYNHSGVQAIRAALSANTTITYKILFNDAVAMTGGQVNDGGLTAARIAAEVRAMGVQNIAVVYDDKEDLVPSAFGGLPLHPRDELPEIQEKFRKIKGVSVILYVQTCAAEKRRRRKIGTFPDPDRRVWINPDVCEGCGDCGVQSNCVSVVPLDTEFGTKRAIDQSSCNKDYSCLKGFCPSFVTLEGAKIRKAATVGIDLGHLPEPRLPRIDGTHNTVITGVGGTGVVTIGAVMAMAAHLDSKGVGLMEMAGLAQKGGAVHLHCRIAERPDDIAAIRVSTGEADALIGGDLVVSAGSKTLGLTATGRTGAVVNSHETITGAFTRDRDFRIPGEQLRLALEARLRDRLAMLDSSQLALRVLGDSIYSNMILLGAAWQAGLVPLTGDALRQAIRLNGTAVEGNLRAFETGRWAVLNPEAACVAARGGASPAPVSLDDSIALRRAHVLAYQDAALARRYDALVAQFADARLREAVAKGYHKLLTYKDEYEVARLHLETAAQVAAAFDGTPRLSFHLAPPMLGGTGPDGRPKKRAFGPWVLRLFRVLAAMKRVRGTWLDPFGRSAERRAERALIAQYEADMAEVLRLLPDADLETAASLAELPLEIRGFGPVKDRAIALAARRRDELLARLRKPATQAAA